MEIRDRIWKELQNSAYYTEMLNIYLTKQKIINKWIEIVLTWTSIFSIVLWSKYASYHPVWALILIAIAVIRLLKSKILISDEHIIEQKRVKDFYIDSYVDLENLWHDVEKGDIDSRIIYSKFIEYLDKEKTISKLTSARITNKERVRAEKKTAQRMRLFHDTK